MKPLISFISLLIPLCFLSCEHPSNPDMGYIKGYVSTNSIQLVYEADVLLHNTIHSEKIINSKYDSKEEALESIQSDYYVLNRKTDAGGYFRFDYVLAGNYSLEVNKGDSIGRVIGVTLLGDDNGLHFDIDLFATGSIAGEFSDGDLFFVKELMRADTCSSGGTLLMSGIPPGVYSVYLFENNVFNEIQGGKVEVFSDSITTISNDLVTILRPSTVE